MVGCATDFDREVKNDPQDVSCPGNGNGKTYIPGKMPDYDLSFNGIQYVYTGADATANVGVENFWNSCTSGTEIELVISPVNTLASGTQVEVTTFIVSSCKYSNKFGQASTYAVSGKASGGWAVSTIV